MLRDEPLHPRNFVPLPYRRVSVQPYAGEPTAPAIRAHLLGREAYRRTDHVVLRCPGDEVAIASIQRRDPAPGALFSEITQVDVLALPATCRFVHLPEVDCGNRTALAEAAAAAGVGPDGTLVVQGLYDHVNFIHRPDPIVLRVVEVVPPHPPKLFDQLRRVLAYADLPPFRLVLERIDLVARARAEAPAGPLLVPCRSGGLDALGADVTFLDERPSRRRDWTLVGCERSAQFHRHYFGADAPRVETCPRALLARDGRRSIVKCCLTEQGTVRDGEVMVVPWGSDLQGLEAALRAIADEVNRG